MLRWIIGGILLLSLVLYGFTPVGTWVAGSLSPDAARAYAWLKVTDRFTVDILRGGERIRLRYQLGG